MASLYVHIPFCSKKCPYCDFNSYARTKQEVESVEKNYIIALLKEATNYDWQEELESIFLGGGTPSLLSEESISDLFTGIRKIFKLKSNCEITMEANPGSIYEPLFKDKLKSFKASGINRISLGCQSFNNDKLKFLGRIHNAEQSKQAIENVKSAGFENFNIDLIYGIQDETLSSWQTDLQSAIELQPKHISAYTLTIEPGTDFGKLSKKGAVLTGDDSTVSAAYQQTQDQLLQSGYHQYEVSNFAQLNFECRHNLIYWSYKNYLGLGAGAHSFKDKNRWINTLSPEKYTEQVMTHGHARQREEDITESQADIEIIYTCLRKAVGLDYSRFKDSIKFEVELRSLIAEGLIIKEENQIRLSKKGFLFSDHVVERLCSNLERKV